MQVKALYAANIVFFVFASATPCAGDGFGHPHLPSGVRSFVVNRSTGAEGSSAWIMAQLGSGASYDAPSDRLSPDVSQASGNIRSRDIGINNVFPRQQNHSINHPNAWFLIAQAVTPSAEAINPSALVNENVAPCTDGFNQTQSDAYPELNAGRGQQTGTTNIQIELRKRC